MRWVDFFIKIKDMPLKDKKKIALVGAGVVGLYLAQKMAAQGYKVTVFEAKKEIGKSSCSGLISNRIVDFIPEAGRFAENKISKARISFPKKDIKLRFNHDFLVIKRENLDKYLASEAQKAGAVIKTGRKVESLPEGFDYIVGSDGARSQVRKCLGLEALDYRLGIRGKVEKKAEESLFCTWPVEGGFLWKLPRGKSLEYGVLAPLEKASDIFDQFLEEREVEIKTKKADLIGKGLSLGNRPDVALCGESAGLTKGWSGGGVVWGLVCADLFLANFPDLKAYRRQVRRFFKKRIFISDLACKLGYKVGFVFPYLIPNNIKIDSDFLL